MAARVLDVPSVSSLTLPGFNVYPALLSCAAGAEAEQRSSVLKSRIFSKCRDFFIKHYSIDMFDEYVSMSFYNRDGLCICTGIRELDPEMPECVKGIYGGMAEDCVYVGPMLISQEEGRISVSRHSPFSFPHDLSSTATG